MTDLNAPDTFIENGQLYLHFLPNSLINNEIRRYNIKTNRQYREYLQNNAPQIINHNFESKPESLGKTIPFTFNCANDNSQPFGYETSDAKQKFLSEQATIANQTRQMRSNYM
jgi:hypothetical protein